MIFSSAKKTRHAIRYLVETYPYKWELHSTRLRQLFFLIDWQMVQKEQRQITSIDWYFDRYGPYNHEVVEYMEKDPYLMFVEDKSPFGIAYNRIEKVNKDKLLKYTNLTESEKNMIDEVIETVKEMTFNEFISYVYDTRPIKECDKYERFNLVKLVQT